MKWAPTATVGKRRALEHMLSCLIEKIKSCGNRSRVIYFGHTILGASRELDRIEVPTTTCSHRGKDTRTDVQLISSTNVREDV